MNPILRGIGQFGNAAENALVKVGAPLAEHTVMPAVDVGSNILGNLQKDFAPPKTQQLPPGVQSPVPQSSIVPHQQAGSWLGMGLNNVLGAISNQMPRLLNAPQQQGVPLQPPIQHPAQPIVNHMTQRFAPTVTPNVTATPTRQPSPTPAPQQAVLGAQTSPVVQPSPTGIEPTAGSMPQQIPGLAPQVSQNFLTTLSQILPVTRQYGIPDALVAGQAAQESGYMQHPAGQNNFFGMRGHSTPWANFQTPQEGATYYAQTITSLVPNIANLSPEQALVALQSGRQRYEGNNPNPMTYVNDIRQNPAWQAFGGQ